MVLDRTLEYLLSNQHEYNITNQTFSQRVQAKPSPKSKVGFITDKSTTTEDERDRLLSLRLQQSRTKKEYVEIFFREVASENDRIREELLYYGIYQNNNPYND